MQAALAAYPELGCTGGPYEVWRMWGVSDNVLCAGNDKTIQFIKDVLAEIIEIFPSEYIHVGGDECPKVRWAKCPKCQARIKASGLKSDKNHTAEERLQSFIINHAEKFLNGHGRQIIGWDEILEGGLAPNATVMSWRGEQGGIDAVLSGHHAIMTPGEYCYFDSYQDAPYSQPEAIGGYLPLEKYILIILFLILLVQTNKILYWESKQICGQNIFQLMSIWNICFIRVPLHCRK